MTFIGKAYMGATTSSNSYELAVDDTGMIGVFASPNRVLVPLQLGWHHIAATVDGATLAVYVDGLLADSLSAMSPPYTDDAVRVGCDFDQAAEEGFLMGMLDDVRLYDRPLTPDEIAALAAL